MIKNSVNNKSKIYRSENQHLNTTLIFNSLILIISILIIPYFHLYDFGIITLFLPIFWMIFSLVKIIKTILFKIELKELSSTFDEVNLNSSIMNNWNRKRIGNNYISLFCSIVLLVIFTVYISLIYSINNAFVANKETSQIFFGIWIGSFASLLLFWNYNNVWLKNLLRVNSKKITVNKVASAMFKLENEKWKNNYKDLTLFLISFIFIIPLPFYFNWRKNNGQKI